MLFDRKLSMGSLLRVFWFKVTITWGLAFFETLMLVFLPLLIGWSIDGLLQSDHTAFFWLVGIIAALLLLGVGRRVFDTRIYGSMRVELGDAVVARAAGEKTSAVNARLTMSRELVDFLETDMPVLMAAIVQVIVAIAVLVAFHMVVAAAAIGATFSALLIYVVFGGRFFRLNRDLNEQAEGQIIALESGIAGALRSHLSALRRHEVRISDVEALVYGLIFTALLAMLCFNLWFATTQTPSTPGQIFSIVMYSYELVEAAVVLPTALQSLTRIAEVTQRINRHAKTAPASG